MSILTTLGVGSGIDTQKLVSDLVAASRSARDTSISTRSNANTAKLSALSTLSSEISTVASSAIQRLTTIADTDLAQLARDLVTSLNTVRTDIGAATAIGKSPSDSGPLVSDSGVRTLSRGLSSLAGSTFSVSGNFTRLADIGITADSSGKLSINETTLQAAITNDPTSVRSLLGAGNTTTGVAGALKTLSDSLTGSGGSLTVSQNRYQRVAKSITDEQTKLDDEMTKMSDRLTTAYDLMDRQVAAFKASQAYLTQQVAMWTKSN